MQFVGRAVVYRFNILPGSEAQFVEHWRVVTLWLRDHCRGLGSRLHRAADGTLVAYAQWPDAATRDRAFASVEPAHVATARQGMRALLLSPMTEEVLTPIADELTLAPSKPLESPV